MVVEQPSFNIKNVVHGWLLYANTKKVAQWQLHQCLYYPLAWASVCNEKKAVTCHIAVEIWVSKKANILDYVTYGLWSSHLNLQFNSVVIINYYQNSMWEKKCMVVHETVNLNKMTSNQSKRNL